jgi:hypothetical protein
VAAHPVAGDGSTDDTASIQAILNDAAGKQVAIFSSPSNNLPYLLVNRLSISPTVSIS